MSVTFGTLSDSHCLLTIDGVELVFKKPYCTTAVDGDYLLFFAHEVETNKFRQQYRILYSDCTSPLEASASDLKDAFDAIINSGISSPVYEAILTQSGTDAPTASVIRNNLGGDVLFNYVDVGIYGLNTDALWTGNVYGELVGAVDVNKILLIVFKKNNADQVQIATIGSDTVRDNGLLSTHIRIYMN